MTITRPEKLVPTIEAQCVTAQQPAHPRHQVALWRLDHQMKVVAHEAIGVNLKPGLGAGFRQRFEEVVAIHIGLIDVFFAVAPARDVINRSRVLDS